MRNQACGWGAGAVRSVVVGLLLLEIFALVFAPPGARPVIACVLAGTATIALVRPLAHRAAAAGGRFDRSRPPEGLPADDARLPPVRRAVREAAHRLAVDAPALTAAGAEPLRAGLEARANALRQAVLDAHRAGTGREDIARDARLDVRTVDEWTARNGRHMTGRRG
ncbi:hypothetical protein [Streptomyces abikoensis]|uniref:hypothetical protein n=1 Tax=Streptomyces abikoensis TaxID=97398 RepID=UPI0034031B51